MINSQSQTNKRTNENIKKEPAPAREWKIKGKQMCIYVKDSKKAWTKEGVLKGHSDMEKILVIIVQHEAWQI